MRTQQIIILFCIITCTPIILGCGATMHQIKITVVDSEDNNWHIGDVDATLFSPDQTKQFGSLKEQVKGKYEGKFPPGQYMLVLKKNIELKGFEELYNDEESKKQLREKLKDKFLSEKKLVRIPLQDKDYIDDSVSLRLQSAIAGRLIDVDSKNGISQADVAIIRTGTSMQKKDTTDSKGVFVIAPLEPGEYRMVITLSDYIIGQSLTSLNLTKEKLLVLELKMKPILPSPGGVPPKEKRIEIEVKVKEVPIIDE